MNDAEIRRSIERLLQTTVLPHQARRVDGGSINDCYRYEISTGSIFVKVGVPSALDRFEAEAAGLNELRAARALRVPQVLGIAAGESHALLVLEWIKFSDSSSTDAKFGEQLAAQHRIAKPLFGWKRHNFIGSTRQVNFWSRNWINFWREHRLEPQLALAEQKGADDSFIERTALLSTLIDGFFVSYAPVASLLHGDLWNGNHAVDSTGAPVIFDPAVYYGDRECDIAMTRLFGGFSPDFYSAYEAIWPLDNGWRQRTALYNLYHVLNHYHLFGGGYLDQAGQLVEKLLSDLGH
jgi:protein-ribulosamine 3-kinase